MIKAIIFDCFGVLVAGSLEKFIDLYVHDDKSLERVGQLNDQANAGYLSYENMIAEYAVIAGISVEETKAVMNENPRNDLLLRYIETNLKQDYKIGLLSNAADNWLDRLLGPDNIQLFDSVVLSCDVNVVKPDERIYKHATEKLGANTNECLFVDDIERYCTAAKDTGMKAVHYKSFKRAIEEMEAILAADSNEYLFIQTAGDAYLGNFHA
jgi:HAD superfamily hydrolase (TIGR01509 family)